MLLNKYNTSSYFGKPDGYLLKAFPRDFHLNNHQIEIDYKASQAEGSVKIIGSYNFKKSVYLPSEYDKIKFYYNEIIRVFNQKVVLVKAEVVN